MSVGKNNAVVSNINTARVHGFCVDMWWLPLGGALFIQRGRNSAVVAGATAVVGHSLLIPARKYEKERERNREGVVRGLIASDTGYANEEIMTRQLLGAKKNHCDPSSRGSPAGVTSRGHQQGSALILRHCFEFERLAA